MDQIEPAQGGALPLGPPMDDRPALTPRPTTIVGRFVKLVPLELEHARPLYDASHGPQAERLWAYMAVGPFSDGAAFEHYIGACARSADPFFFAILDRKSHRVLGQASFLRITPEHRCIEVGHILYTPALQRTPAGTEAIYLLARHAFEELRYRRLEWKCDSLNAPSRRAACRYGFTFEGVFRQHMIVKQRSRDTAWYAMLEAEWPARKAGFERWLAPENFDRDGRQAVALGELMGVSA